MSILLMVIGGGVLSAGLFMVYLRLAQPKWFTAWVQKMGPVMAKHKISLERATGKHLPGLAAGGTREAEQRLNKFGVPIVAQKRKAKKTR